MITTVAILGYGRFGQSLAGRLAEKQCTVRAYDPVSEVPSHFFAASAEAAIADAELVVLAMPVAQIRVSLLSLKPHLQSTHVVMDVGSVKSGPAAVMEEVLGADVPWVATHPLFGPLSLARGERPLQFVVCPNRQHPTTVTRVEDFLRLTGFDVSTLDPENHDREMAATHALAFFVAKGFLDSELLLDSKYAPPSVRAIRRTLDSVQADAGQLFTTLHRENPYAAEMRAKLLNALIATDDALRAPVEEGVGEIADLEDAARVKSSDSAPPQLSLARELIDEIDADLLLLLARRAELSMRAARAKAEVGKGVRDTRREAELLIRRRDIADHYGLDPDAVEGVFTAILNFSRRHQSDRLQQDT